MECFLLYDPRLQSCEAAGCYFVVGAAGDCDVNFAAAVAADS